ncbi:unnamed protein product [Sphenostylis stenocarpa]|uniref:Uncharacterized protein n=1 Tax=Sphenostylis stenocarpa TaxID=92480 RepID=A0AA86RYL9_9FABA|nr:unnamed protein product [Sphenostylis stenocarpa]
MDINMKKSLPTEQKQNSEDIRKGPWSLEEDTILQNYVATYGEGRWNSVARSAGTYHTLFIRCQTLSALLRWLNYLRPDVRRGNITLQEQLTILDLHSRWGNRWSKIARHLPGRTDNEIKNYWRTRVIKQARNLNCDVDSKQFKDALRYVWMPRLIERIQPSSETHDPPHVPSSKLDLIPDPPVHHQIGSHGSCSGSTTLDSEELGYNVSIWGGCEDLEQGTVTVPLGGGDLMESFWDDENLWLMRQICDDLELKDNFLT